MATQQNKGLSEQDMELLERARQAKARREARKAEAEERRKQQEKIREQRKAAGMKLKTDAEKAEDFKRLAKQRVKKAVKDIKLVGNLANRSQYNYTDEQAAKVMSALSDALQAIGSRFESTTGGADDFDL